MNVQNFIRNDQTSKQWKEVHATLANIKVSKKADGSEGKTPTSLTNTDLLIPSDDGTAPRKLSAVEMAELEQFASKPPVLGRVVTIFKNGGQCLVQPGEWDGNQFVTNGKPVNVTTSQVMDEVQVNSVIWIKHRPEGQVAPVIDNDNGGFRDDCVFEYTKDRWTLASPKLVNVRDIVIDPFASAAAEGEMGNLKLEKMRNELKEQQNRLRVQSVLVNAFELGEDISAERIANVKAALAV